MTDSMSVTKYRTLLDWVEKLEPQVRQMASWETASRDEQLRPHRGTNEAILVGLETIAAGIRLGETIPGAPLTESELSRLADRMATLAAQARRVWNQPAGRYEVEVPA